MVELTWDTAGALTLVPLWGTLHSARLSRELESRLPSPPLPGIETITQNSPYQSSPSHQPAPPNCHLISHSDRKNR